MASAHFHPLQVRQVHAATRDAIVVTFDVPPALQQEFAYVQGQYLTLRTHSTVPRCDAPIPSARRCRTSACAWPSSA